MDAQGAATVIVSVIVIVDLWECPALLCVTNWENTNEVRLQSTNNPTFLRPRLLTAPRFSIIMHCVLLQLRGDTKSLILHVTFNTRHCGHVPHICYADVGSVAVTLEIHSPSYSFWESQKSPSNFTMYVDKNDDIPLIFGLCT